MPTAYRVVELWRYPVASIGGETVPSTLVGTQGPVGDRMFVLFDAASGAPAAPEKDRRWHKALLLSAFVRGYDIPTIRFPHGTELALDDGRAPSCLSEFFGFGVGIGRIGPGEDRRGFPSIEHRQHHFPIHVLTIESLRHLARLRERETVDVRRFRPNILLHSQSGDEAGFAEASWIGKQGRTDHVSFAIKEEATRCGMTIIPQPGIEDDPEILRTILRQNRRRLGAYATVEEPGLISVGDQFEVS